ncbi:hypothetical protein [Candidatus Nitrososphaera sp. FF02]|uniref:hypothetical protein n=1 Tax=Candidatus Nitrososphaera sp. FF02 TaxID=3398226 RepID=UPI0039E945D1
MSDNDERIIRELITLGKKTRLNRNETDRARVLFRNLKTRLENEAISNATGWKLPTVKYYTKGVDTTGLATSESSIDSVSRAIESGLTPEKAKEMISWKEVLDSQNVSAAEVGILISEARNQNIDIKSIVSVTKNAKNAGMSLAELGQILNYKKLLDNMGITEKRLGEIHHLISKQGEGRFDMTMEFLRGMADLQTLKKQQAELSSAKQSLEEQVKSTRLQLEALGEQKQKTQKSLDLLTELERKGFGKESLEKLTLLSQRHGGPAGVINSIYAYEKLQDIEAKVDGLTAQKQKLEGEITALKENLASLQGQAESIKATVNQTLDSMQKKLEEVISTEEGILYQTFNAERQRLSKVIDQYAEAAKQSDRLVEELNLARIFLAAQKEPLAIQRIPTIYAINFLELASKILLANDINPKISDYDKVGDTLIKVIVALHRERKS